MIESQVCLGPTPRRSPDLFAMSVHKSFFRIEGDSRAALDHISRTMREMSLQEDPQAVVRIFGEQVRNYQRTDGFVALSRRGLPHPQYRITRSSRWTETIDPWKQVGELPVLSGGLMGELLYGDVPRLIEEIEVADDDPAREYFEGHRSLIAIPHYDHGVGLNMVLMLGKEPGMFPPSKRSSGSGSAAFSAGRRRTWCFRPS